MMDILGFKALINRISIKNIVQRMEYVFRKIPNVDSVCCEFSRDAKYTRNLTLKCGAANFSDTLLLWSQPINPNDHRESFPFEKHFFRTVSNIIFHAFLADIPLRVGVSFGEVYIDTENNIFLGQAIIDAHLIEIAQDWVGGALHPNCPVILLLEQGYSSEFIASYEVPIKTDNNIKLKYAIDWTSEAQLSRPISIREFGVFYRERMEQQYSKLLTDAPETAKAKYINAKEFTDLMIIQGRKRLAEGLFMNIGYGPKHRKYIRHK